MLGSSERQAVLGKGPQVRFYDPTAISNRRLVRLVEETGKAMGLPLQFAVRRSGGTDAATIHRHRRGVPTVVIGVPARYIHTHVTLIHFRDYVQAIDLVLELVQRLDAETVAGLADFGRPPAGTI
jgi:endoglucanase